MLELFDTHAHYNDEKFNEDREEVISSVKADGITQLVCVGYDIKSSIEAKNISDKYDFIYHTCGISPNDIPQTEEELWKQLEEISNFAKNKSQKLVAIGEIGLDYYWNTENKDLQKIAFIEQIKLANELDLPIVIHTREAVMDTIDILKNKINVKNVGIFHCCPLNRELVKEALKLGFYISFAGPVTFKNSKNADEIIEMCPIDKILIETDSPYLSPEPNRGKRNDSRNVRFIAQKIADVKKMSIEEIAKVTYENALKIYKIKDNLYDIKEIEEKANYCLNCKIKPCSLKGCPLNNDIPEFIKCVKDKKYKEAYNVLTNTTVLSSVCGRICPHKKQCQGSCVRGMSGKPVSIGELEAYVGDMAIKNGYKLFEQNSKYDDNLKSKKVAIVGGGPAGLTCAAFLSKNGIDVTIYEKYDYLGGLLVHGIPRFRLPKEVIDNTINKIIELGIKVKYNTALIDNEKKKDIDGKEYITLDKLKENYDAIFLSFGANNSAKMGVEGENYEGVYGGNELLEYNLHPDYNGKNVAIIGGGNVAMDCARTIKRLGAKSVKVIYRRSEKQMPAEQKEVEDAKREQIEFLFQNNIVRILGNEIENKSGIKKVSGIELIKTELIKKDGESREVPVNIENSNYIIDIDYVVSAIGSVPDEFTSKLGLDLNKYGGILINDNMQTSDSKIFAGGDIIDSRATVAYTARSGRDASEKIIEYLLKN